jgi:ribonuclease HI
VNFVWTPGHEEIEGNERAGEEAQKAAKGETSPVNELPPFLMEEGGRSYCYY